jgi:hypothetical protein
MTNDMSVTLRNVIKILPGKMEEGMNLVLEWVAIAGRVVGASSRCFRPMSGGGDTTRTMIWEMELGSLADVESHPMKIGADPEMQKLFPKLNAVIDCIEVEFYWPIPTT